MNFNRGFGQEARKCTPTGHIWISSHAFRGLPHVLLEILYGSTVFFCLTLAPHHSPSSSSRFMSFVCRRCGNVDGPDCNLSLQGNKLSHNLVHAFSGEGIKTRKISQ